MCDLIGAEYKQGNSRTLQLQGFGENGFHRFFNFEKIGYGKYKIIEIYETPLYIKNNRDAGNSSVYLPYIELIMLRYLAAEYGREITFSRKRLWKLLGMINEKYGSIENEKLLELNKVITSYEIDNFYFRANHKLDRILKTALNNLSNRSLIEAIPKTIICKIINGYEKHVAATDEEIAIILSVNREKLDEFNCETISQVILRKKQKDFFKKVNDELYKRYGWKYYYRAYKIIFNYEDIKSFIPRLELNLKDAISGLNSKIIDVLNSEAENLYNNKLQEYNKGIDEAQDENSFMIAIRAWHYPENYVIAQKLLAKELISICDRDSDYVDNIFDSSAEYDEINKELEELFLVDD